MSLFEIEPADPVAEAERLRGLVGDREKRLADAYRKIRALEERLQLIDASKREVELLRSELDDRFREISLLTAIAESGSASSIPGGARDNAPPLAQKVVRRLGLLLRNSGGGLKKDIALVRRSGTFDERWYLQRYPDVGKAGMDPVRHYLLHGAAEGRDPSPGFSTSGYRSAHPGVAESGVNPLIHYIRSGGKGVSKNG